MSTPPVSPSTPPRVSRAETGDASGWVLFAAILLLMSGAFSVMFGLAAIINDEVVTVGGDQGPTIWDFTAWGWITLIIGAVMILTGLGLFAGNRMARWLGVAFATLNALVQFGTISAFPLWSLMVIALDVIIIHQLVARWYE
jgi:hypothetical protein